MKMLKRILLHGRREGEDKTPQEFQVTVNPEMQALVGIIHLHGGERNYVAHVPHPDETEENRLFLFFPENEFETFAVGSANFVKVNPTGYPWRCWLLPERPDHKALRLEIALGVLAMTPGTYDVLRPDTSRYTQIVRTGDLPDRFLRDEVTALPPPQDVKLDDLPSPQDVKLTALPKTKERASDDPEFGKYVQYAINLMEELNVSRLEDVVHSTAKVHNFVGSDMHVAVRRGTQAALKRLAGGMVTRPGMPTTLPNDCKWIYYQARKHGRIVGIYLEGM